MGVVTNLPEIKKDYKLMQHQYIRELRWNGVIPRNLVCKFSLHKLPKLIGEKNSNWRRNRESE